MTSWSSNYIDSEAIESSHLPGYSRYVSCYVDTMLLSYFVGTLKVPSDNLKTKSLL